MLGSVNRLDLAGDPRNYTNYHEPVVKFRVISWIVFPSIAMSNSFGYRFEIGCGVNVGPLHRGPSGVHSNSSMHICRTFMSLSQA